jgi:hypothetical protein
MHAPAHPLDKHRLGAVWRASVHIEGGRVLFLDRARFEAADPGAPWALFQGPLPSLTWLVRGGDGAVGAVWDGVFHTSDPDLVRQLDHPNPISLLLAARTGAGNTPQPEGSFALESWRGDTPPVWTCLAANAAARTIPALYIAQERAAAGLDAFHRSWMQDMDDPFPDLTGYRAWSDAQAAQLHDLARDVLCAMGYTQGVYAIGSAKDDHSQLHFYDPNAWESDARINNASAVLRHLTDSRVFRGWTLEYNDGARDRASGYDMDSATICKVDVGQTSAHGQMAGKRRTLDRLAATPDQGRAVLHLLDTTA